jgi:signal transduction histidine kinase
MALNRRLLVQVTMPAVLIGLVLLGTCIVGIRSLNRLEANRDRVLSRNEKSLQAALQLEVRLRQLRIHSFLFVMDPSEVRQNRIENDHRQFEEALDRAKQTVQPGEERQLVETIEAEYRHYRNELKPLPSDATKSDVLRWADTHPIVPLLKPCEQLLQVERDAIETTTQESQAITLQTRHTLLLLGILGPVGGVVAGFGVAWGLSRSFTRLSVRLQDVHAHLDRDLGSVRLAAEGDLGQIDQQLEQAAERVREVVGQVQERERELLRSEQLAAVGQLAAGVAHEVRNPLASIKLLVGAALKARPPRSLSTEDLQVIHDQVGRLESRVQALLDFARPPETLKRPCDLGQVVRRSLDLVQARMRQQNVRQELDLSDEAATVLGDPDQLTTVVVNLFLNALDAMPAGGRLTVRLRDDPPGTVRLSVLDTGPGIDPALIGRLFTPFTSTKPTGTGLGLSICRRVVREHGGALIGENIPEGGACFVMTLPACKDEGGRRKDESAEVAF